MTAMWPFFASMIFSSSIMGSFLFCIENLILWDGAEISGCAEANTG